MGDISLPTAGDYARNSAQSNQQELHGLSLRLREIEKAPSKVNESAEIIRTLRSENSDLRAEIELLRAQLRDEFAGVQSSMGDGRWREVSPTESDLKRLPTGR